jgi:hypothetical protein
VSRRYKDHSRGARLPRSRRARFGPCLNLAPQRLVRIASLDAQWPSGAGRAAAAAVTDHAGRPSIVDAKSNIATPNSQLGHSAGGEFGLPITGVTIWYDVVAVLSALGARTRPKAVPEVSVYDASPTTVPIGARQIALHAMREEEPRLLR